MRNLVQYPITPQEVRDCLLRLEGELTCGEDGGIGCMDPLLLKTAAEVVSAAWNVVQGIERRFTENERSYMRYVTPWKEAAELIDAFNKFNPKAPTNG